MSFNANPYASPMTQPEQSRKRSISSLLTPTQLSLRATVLGALGALFPWVFSESWVALAHFFMWRFEGAEYGTPSWDTWLRLHDCLQDATMPCMGIAYVIGMAMVFLSLWLFYLAESRGRLAAPTLH